MRTKSFKDPAYGYVEIPADLVASVIDTQAFQRLRRIVQTSYEPLYPSATHNRFVHSLGVFHLGDYVAGIIEEKSLGNLDTIIKSHKKKYERYLKIFRYACLLHDIGHAPFSHTGESFYITHDENGRSTKLHRRVARLCGDNTFYDEIGKREKTAAPHELMSIVIALSTFARLFKSNAEKNFFARAIAGYPFRDKSRSVDCVDPSFLNCLISLLNSSIIDVDRLDYLIRDAVETGFKTVSIDYQRLLGGVRIITADGRCDVAFTKRAVSVLENVVYAHDAERKWVQSHPAIGYEMKLLKEAFAAVDKKFAADLKGKTIFCEDALTSKGIKPSKCHKTLKLSLLCDADLIFLMKNTDAPSIRQYTNRSARYMPLWKSEAEFCALFNTDIWHDDLKPLKKIIESFLAFLRRQDITEINDSTFSKLKIEARNAATEVKRHSSNQETTFVKIVSSGQKDIFRKLVKALKDFAKANGLPFKFQILDAKSFTSGFATDNLPHLPIELGPQGQTVEFGKITRVLGSRAENDSLPKNIYYVFCEKIHGDKAQLSHALVSNLKRFIEDNRSAIGKFFSSH